MFHAAIAQDSLRPDALGRPRRVEQLLKLDGQNIYLREVLPKKVIPGRWVLFVHGNTFPSETP